MYSETLLEHFRHPRNIGELPDADRVGRGGSPDRGMYMVIHIALQGDRVREIRYQTVGCGPSIAAGSVMTEMAKGRTVAECLTLTDEEIVAALGGLPEHKLHCAALATDALRNALAPPPGPPATDP